MRLEQMNWMDVERYLTSEDRLIFITGALEQHSMLSVLTDILIPLALADAVAQRESVAIAPPLNFGVSPYFASYPGTVSLRLETFTAVVKEIAAQFIGQGFKRILFLNGHGGNPIKTIVDDLSAQFPEACLVPHNWWIAPRAKAFADAHGLLQSHANWQENFTFTRIGDAPAGSKPAVNIPPGLSPARTRELLGDGSYGGPYQQSDALMAEFMAECVDEITGILREMKIRE